MWQTVTVSELRKYEIHVVVAAMNSDLDACTFTPALVPTAVTVGATNITDSMAFFSNYGSCLDLSAPGVEIGSVCVDRDCSSNTGIIYTDGTSVAAPHVSGVVALWLSQVASSYTNVPASVAAVTTALQCTTVQGRLKLKDPYTPNLLLQIPPQVASLSDAYASCNLLSTTCPLGANSLMCSGHGICFEGGVCRCDTYWDGSTCDVNLNTCSVSCGDHGTCVFDYCECESGWFGDECNLQCEGDGGVICSGHGTCESGVCSCETAWTGDLCDSTCADVAGVVCSGHGVCVSGECKCDALYYGSACESYDTTYLTDSYCCDGLHLYDWTANPFLTIAMFWTDLDPSDELSGGVYAGTINNGTGYAVVFDRVVLMGTSCTITMELLLHSNGDFDLAIVDNDIGTDSGCEGYEEYYYGPVSYYAWVVVGMKSAYDRGKLEYDELIARQWNHLPASVHYEYVKIALPTSIPTSIPTTSTPSMSPITSSPTMPGETNKPTVSPTYRPSRAPTTRPTYKPSTSPTIQPTKTPTLTPTFRPSAQPTAKPSHKPTYRPTGVPSRLPTLVPTRKPTVSPTPRPTVKGTLSPTGELINQMIYRYWMFIVQCLLPRM
jgi:hypothetical protein